MDSLVKGQVDKLQEGLSTWKYCYSRVAVSFIAVSHGSIFHLLAGQLELGTEIDLGSIPTFSLRSAKVFAGRFLAPSHRTLDAILNEAALGWIQSIGPQLKIMSPEDGPRSAFYTGDVEDSRSGYQLVRNLYLDGYVKQDLPKTGYNEQQVVEVLQSSSPPFRDLGDLTNEIGMRRDLLSRGSSLLVSGRSPARFDAATAFSDDGEVIVSFSTGKNVHTGGLKFSYIARKADQIVGREEIPNLHNLERARQGGGHEFRLNLPSHGGDSMSLFLSYGDRRLLSYDLKAPPKQKRRFKLSEMSSTPILPEGEYHTPFDVYSVAGQAKGEGGSGRVFPVTDAAGDTWAVKVIKPEYAVSEEKVKRFRNELGFCFRTKHPNILRVQDWGYVINKSKDGKEIKCPFFVMPYYAKTLRNLFADRVEFSTKFLYWRHVLEGLRAAHRERVIHRDIKPENILIHELGPRAILADFGIAHFEEEDLLTSMETSTGAKMANARYAAPEQLVKGAEVDHRADIYALGCILNELFTGAIPHGVDFPLIADVAPRYAPLDEVVKTMLKHNPDKRFQNLDEVEQKIAASLDADLLTTPERAEEMPVAAHSLSPEP